MAYTPAKIQRTYILLVLANTLAASFIWGINTIFLLDAGLSNFEAFAANAFFTAGMVLFEVPTGVIADTRGRRVSFILGAITLIATTLLYYLLWQISAPFWAWAVVSALLGLGFTFFSGALEAWLVDALAFTGFTGKLESVFAKGQVANGVAMLTGSVLGGAVAQVTDLGVPYLLRSSILCISLGLAFFLMRDLGFTPHHGKSLITDIKKLLHCSIEQGFKNPPVKWLMLAAPFSTGVGVYVFYAMQPYLLQLYGDNEAYTIAGLVAAVIAGAQIAGGLAAPRIGRLFKRRTSALLFGVVATIVVLALSGLVAHFWAVLVLLVVWGLLFTAITPIRQAYLNSNIPSEQRATVLSFDSLMGSSGGVVTQPLLGRAADAYGYAPSYLISAVIQCGALPFLLQARRQHTPADYTDTTSRRVH